MWAYDLTGGAAHRQAAQARLEGRGAALHADAAASTTSRRRTSTTTRRPTTRASRSRSRKTAADYGAVVANYATLVGLDEGRRRARSRGARVARRRPRDRRPRAASIVNATGVWADEVRALDEGTHPSTIRPAKGIHITVPWSLVRNEIAAVIPVPKDRRSVFVVPWGGEGGAAPLHVHRHHRHRLRRPDRRPADHRRRRRVPPRARSTAR